MKFTKNDPRINRNGAPKKTHSITEILNRLGKERIEIKIGDKIKRVPRIEAALYAVYRAATNGNRWAMDFIADRTEGKVAQKIEGGENPIRMEDHGFDWSRLPIKLRKEVIKAMEEASESDED